jgi:RNA recognition motif-containing protein
MRQAGEVLHAQIITEFNTGRSKGCGIVEYATDEEAQMAITTLTDSAVPFGRTIIESSRRRMMPKPVRRVRPKASGVQQVIASGAQ